CHLRLIDRFVHVYVFPFSSKWFAGEHFEQYCTNAINISCLTELLLREHFRRKIVLVIVEKLVAPRREFHERVGQCKILKLNFPVIGDSNRFGTNEAVDQSLLIYFFRMNVFEGSTKPAGYKERMIHCERKTVLGAFIRIARKLLPST